MTHECTNPWRVRACSSHPAYTSCVARPAAVVLAACCVFVTARPAGATEYIALDLHHMVQLSETIVVARVLDPERATVRVERRLKGDTPQEITLVDYVDGFLRVEQRKPLTKGARELLFLNRKSNAYAPLQTQFSRFGVFGNRIADPFRGPHLLSDAIASIERLANLQARASQRLAAADRAFVEAFRSTDPAVLEWALDESYKRVKAPSDALSDAMLANWPEHLGEVANAMLEWRLRRAAPVFAKSLADAADGDVRAYAAMALGGTGDTTYLELLRRVSSSDAYPLARALAYSGIMSMIGPDAFADLRRGAADSQERVRSQAVVDLYNMLELEESERLWPPASDSLIDEVVAFLQGMQSDPARYVALNAKSMLANIARHRK